MRFLYNLVIHFISEKLDIAPVIPQIFFLILIGFVYDNLAPGGLGLNRGFAGLYIYLGISFFVIVISIIINGKNWLTKPSRQKISEN